MRDRSARGSGTNLRQPIATAAGYDDIAFVAAGIGLRVPDPARVISPEDVHGAAARSGRSSGLLLGADVA